jgi:hypothetical protein
MNRARLTVLLAAVAVPVAIASACNDDPEIVTPLSQGGAGGSGGGQAGGGGTAGSGGGPECVDDEDCNGGVCNDGVCCGSADLVCAAGCCASGEVCLFDACVTPGDDCYSAVDCPDGHYCEPALGDDTGGGGMGGNCTQPLIPGKCLPLPDVCEDGETPEQDGCVPKCEYHPPIGQLDADIRWQWGYDPAPAEFPDKADVWATPAVARLYDANCDGKVDLADPPNVAFVSGDSQGTCCHCTGQSPSACLTGVLRLLDGRSGAEIWSLDKAEMTSTGFAGLSVALGDVDKDQKTDIVAITGEGKVAVIDATGTVTHLSSDVVNGAANTTFGWGGGIALGDMDNDGWPEIAYGRSVFTMAGGSLALLFHGAEGAGGVAYVRLSHFADLDGDGDLELIAGRTAYNHDGTSFVYNNTGFDGFSATGDFDGDGAPEVVLVSNGAVRVIEAAGGATELSYAFPAGSGEGGPPTVANFDDQPGPEIGVATATNYWVLKPNYATSTLDLLWNQSNHDLSSSQTGSSVFDFQGDGRAEVVYNDECFLWVYDGLDGSVLFTANTQSFTATEATIVADVNGDGHAEIIMGSNGADPASWTCAHHTSGTDGYPVWTPPPGASDYRGVTVFADTANSWVGTRTLWNQHAYNVTNVCDPRDSACTAGSYYGEIPTQQQKNWTLPWLNNFRQNVQDGGIFDAPDVTVKLAAECVAPVPLEITVRNQGLSGLPDGVEIGLFRLGGGGVQVGSVTTQKALLPGQTEILHFTVPAALGTTADTYQARVIIDPLMPTFHECNDGNNESPAVTPECVN